MPRLQRLAARAAAAPLQQGARLLLPCRACFSSTAAAAAPAPLPAAAAAPAWPRAPPAAPGRLGLVRFEERRLLHFPLQHVYGTVAAVDQYKAFVPWCVNSVVVRAPQAPGAPLEAELAVGFHAFSERYTSRVTLAPQRSVVAVASGTTLFSHLVNMWEFEPGPTPGSTWLTFRVEFQFRSQLYAAVSQMFFNEVVKNMVQAFEGRCRDTLAAFEAQQRAEAAAAASAKRAVSAAAAEVAAAGAAAGGRPGGAGAAAGAATAARRAATAVKPLGPGVW
jgi:ribosome-associated toxin RatA of RatAB toxin-antitoxin module